jgi:hypothetical protein
VAKPGLIYTSNADMPTLCTGTLHIYYSVLLGAIAAGVQDARVHKDTGVFAEKRSCHAVLVVLFSLGL